MDMHEYTGATPESAAQQALRDFRNARLRAMTIIENWRADNYNQKTGKAPSFRAAVLAINFGTGEENSYIRRAARESIIAQTVRMTPDELHKMEIPGYILDALIRFAMRSLASKHIQDICSQLELGDAPISIEIPDFDAAMAKIHRQRIEESRKRKLAKTCNDLTLNTHDLYVAATAKAKANEGEVKQQSA